MEKVWLWGVSLIERLISWLGLPYIFAYTIEKIIFGVALLVFIAVSVLYLIWLERKVSAHMQSRMGPMHVGGWRGWAQTIADMVKLLFKEDIIPSKADKWVHRIAPIVVFVPSLMAFLVIPFEKNLIVQDLNIGILLIFAFSSIAVLAIIMGGWSSNNKYTLLGGIRSAAQMVSYEIPLVLSILSIVMVVGSLKLNDMVAAQSGDGKFWFVFTQPLAFILYLVAGTAEVNRVPFDIPEAESEIVSGYNTEYSGLKYGFYMLSEFTNMLIISMVAATVFLGGWSAPAWLSFLPGVVVLLIKTYFIVFILMWFRWTFPRLRVDRLMDFGWKILIPLAFLNIFIIGLRMVVFKW
ncbi:MAG: NADH-quinone oxidoreductase subunit H [Candidatus Firestonebacteria bacterium RIFOXYC2_FULL_39_67]|nr:MAG: NADH-quinone oxidoreductase subunit H [Candidatus Firestonebacteria bacterium RIFOXYD2_FULL_39_29]OGF53263.1 MAG: NADH-quinone oxidoreductase subunit H [Candidatus Firestonebacteria bacterium RifOxyC12_full_39_7]OGF55830.1 MAG: NADH-quinone oxidoreductase subunit H [Candidatus Firestonebacteria bacterium RIFOXYC2_FULL_39_67]